MAERLSVSQLSVSIDGGPAIVDDISFEIQAGETFALLGESGCGKSMTALSLMRLLPEGLSITGGEIRLEKNDLLELPERLMRKVRGGEMAMIFQEPGLSLNPVMTIGAQIIEALRLHQDVHGEAAHDQGIALLSQVGIADAGRRMGEYPFQLSGGMKQRVMIAMALAGKPKLLIADEPTTALDVTMQAQVLQLLQDTQKQHEMALLLITHDLGVVAKMAHRVGVMYAGHMVEQAPRAQLFSRPAHPYTQRLFAALPDASRRGQPLAAIPGNVPPLSDLPSGCRFAPRCEQAWQKCTDEAPEWTSLEGGQQVRCHLYTCGDAVRTYVETRHESATQSIHAEEGTQYDSVPELLQVENLKVHFPIRRGILQRTVGYVRAVDGVSLQLKQGRTMALVGESGCGKSTAGKALLQLVQPTSGQVMFSGNELTGLSQRELRRKRAGMQMIFQDPYASLNPKMRVAEILQEGMQALGMSDSDETVHQRISEVLEQVGLNSAARWRYPHEFSGGQRQRIAIARALAVSPKLLICDEPTSALDVSVQAQILNLLKDLQKNLGLGYLFITHNLAVVDYLAHEIGVMYLGRLVEQGKAEEVLRRPQHPYTQALLAAAPRLDAAQNKEIVRLPGEPPSPSHPPSGCHFHLRCAHAMPACREVYPDEIVISDTHRVRCFLAGKLN